MFTLEILLLGIALSVDAAIVCFAFGIVGLSLSQPYKLKHCLGPALTFGLFQSLMLWMGSFAGHKFSFSHYGHLFHLMVASIFLLMSLKVFKDSLENDNEDKELNFGFIPLLVLGTATSIDALAAGVGFGTLPHAYEAAFLVGMITLTICVIFYLLAQFLKNIPEKWLMRFTALIFMALGIQIFWDFASRGML